MATVTLQIVNQCASGGHSTLRLTKGARTLDFPNLIREDFTEPLSDHDFAGWVRVMLKIGGEGRTPAQIRSALLAGVDISVTF